MTVEVKLRLNTVYPTHPIEPIAQPLSFHIEISNRLPHAIENIRCEFVGNGIHKYDMQAWQPVGDFHPVNRELSGLFAFGRWGECEALQYKRNSGHMDDHTNESATVEVKFLNVKDQGRKFGSYNKRIDAEIALKVSYDVVDIEAVAALVLPSTGRERGKLEATSDYVPITFYREEHLIRRAWDALKHQWLQYLAGGVLVVVLAILSSDNAHKIANVLKEAWQKIYCILSSCPPVP